MASIGIVDLTGARGKPLRGINCRVQINSGVDLGAVGSAFTGFDYIKKLSNSLFMVIEQMTLTPILEEIVTDPITQPTSIHDTYQNGCDVVLKGTRKSNNMLLALAQSDAFKGSGYDRGATIGKFQVVVDFEDPNTQQMLTATLDYCSFQALDGFQVGGGRMKQEEGCKIHAEVFNITPSPVAI